MSDSHVREPKHTEGHSTSVTQVSERELCVQNAAKSIT